MTLDITSQSDRVALQVNGGTLIMTVTPTDFDLSLESFKPDPRLDGKPIRAGEAAGKYKISQPNLSNWAKRGIVSVIKQQPRLLELDEASVARAAAIYKFLCKRHSKIHAGRLLSQLLAD